MDSHLSAEDIAAFILGELESDQEERVFEHLDQCPKCVSRLAPPVKAVRRNPFRASQLEERGNPWPLLICPN